MEILNKTIGIVGAGFTGTALLAELAKLSREQITIYLFEKTGVFGAGFAYNTPYPHHLLNARAKDMSAFLDQPAHFVNWLTESDIAKPHLDLSIPISEQFVPRFLYREYLQAILIEAMQQHKNITCILESQEVIAADIMNQQVRLTLANDKQITVDKLVLAMGNEAPNNLPFEVDARLQVIENPWDYQAIAAINADDTVLIVGMGLSMIDVVLSLYHQGHCGKIIAISRHGLLPLPHSENNETVNLQAEALPTSLSQLMRYLRTKVNDFEDWRVLINAMRTHVPMLWQKSDARDKSRFMRHVLPYWNIHRHRVHEKLHALIHELKNKNQLDMLAGRVESASVNSVKMRLRHSGIRKSVQANWIVNCIGPSLSIDKQSKLVKQLLKAGYAARDHLSLGLAIADDGALLDQEGKPSPYLFTLGPMAQGKYWESLAVPEIRVQTKRIAKTIIG